MSQPIYETPVTSADERAFAKDLAGILRVRFEKLARRDAVDYAVIDEFGDVAGWAELKCRTTASNTYPDYMISLSKLLRGQWLVDLTETEFLIAVRFADGRDMVYHRYPGDRAGFRVRIKGRTDRGDPEDIEPCALIPMSAFEEL